MQEISIQSQTGTLSGVLHQSLVADSSYVLVVCHGFRGSKDGGGRAILLADAAAACGVTVVRFDFTPDGSLTQQVDELSSVVEFCRECLGDKIIVLGRSMGGSASLVYAANDTELSGLCLWSTPCNLAETFRLALGESYNLLAGGQQIMVDDEYGKIILQPQFISDFNRYDLYQYASRLVTTPVLIVHGDQDDIVPLRQPQSLFQLIPGEREFKIIAGGDHRFQTCYDQVQREFLAWLRRLIIAVD